MPKSDRHPAQGGKGVSLVINEKCRGTAGSLGSINRVRGRYIHSSRRDSLSHLIVNADIGDFDSSAGKAISKK